MRTEPACLDCFLQQSLAAARRSGADDELQARVLAETGRLLATLDRAVSPPENAVAVYGRIAELTGMRDPFAEVKAASNRFALGLQAAVRDRIRRAVDPLRAALRYSIAANIIDYGTGHEFDARQILEESLHRPLVLDDYEQFRQAVTAGPGVEVLYLADNCGEIVFDGLLAEQLLALGCRVTMAVRGEAILNDATMADARECGLHTLLPVISNGTGCPGTLLTGCSDEFRRAFARARVVVSKGQGNYETLAGAVAPLFFLLTVKCAVVARKITSDKGLAPGRLTGEGEMILMQH